MKIIIKTLLLVQIRFVTHFILLPGASLLPDVTYVHNVLATSLISLLHTVLDGGPRKWTYEDPIKPMTYQQCIIVCRRVARQTSNAYISK